MARQTSSGPHLVTETPSLITCAKCRAPVMAATVGGLAWHIDTVAINQLGEFDVLMQGRATFNLSGDRLWQRSPEKIASGKSAQPVLPEHKCGRVVPDAHMDHAWLEAATAIVIKACGGVVVGGETIAFQPPF